jgi:hypothetical protein
MFDVRCSTLDVRRGGNEFCGGPDEAIFLRTPRHSTSHGCYPGLLNVISVSEYEKSQGKGDIQTVSSLSTHTPSKSSGSRPESQGRYVFQIMAEGIEQESVCVGPDSTRAVGRFVYYDVEAVRHCMGGECLN